MDHSSTQLRMLLEHASHQLAQSHAEAIEEALWTGIIRVNGRMPDISVIRQFASVREHAQGQDRWVEYRWKDETMFETRIITTEKNGRTFIGTEIRFPKMKP